VRISKPISELTDAELWDMSSEEDMLLYSREADPEAAATRQRVEDHIEWLGGDADLYKEGPPVSIREFITGRAYMDAGSSVYPQVMRDLAEIVDTGPHVEVVLSGGIGSAKTSKALFLIAYELYRLSCYNDPHEVFGLDPSSEIVFIFQSITERLAKTVDYRRFKAMIDASPYFRKHFDYVRAIESKMVFDNRIEVQPIAGTATGALGQNIIGGLIDEINFMEVIEASSKATGESGRYDQAAELYNAIARRRETRFMRAGTMPGVLCLTSSARYPGQFTDRKRDEAKDPRSGIYYSHRRVWDIKPEGTYGGERFCVYAGDATSKPRIMKEGEERADRDDMYVEVPVEFRLQFERDLYGALRDVTGLSTHAMHPYIQDTDAVARCFGGVLSVLSRDECDFQDTTLRILHGRFENKGEPRWCHIDLSLSNDATGVAMGFVQGFTEVERSEGVSETMPEITYDFVLRVTPPRNGEIIYEKIRALLYLIRKRGVNLVWVSLDGYQSNDMIQILRRHKFKSGLQSIDKTRHPYDCFKGALMDGRIDAPYCEAAIEEITRLELDPSTGKVDHPPRGKKDISDAMAGVAFGLTTSKMTWINHNVPIMQIPEHVSVQSRARGTKAPEDDARRAGPADALDITDTEVFDFRGDPNTRRKNR